MANNPLLLYQNQKSSVGWRDELIEKYLPLVHHVLGRLQVHLPPHLAWDDLVGAGVIGLIQAAKTYQPSQGATFKTYAFIRIRGAILDDLRKSDPVSRRSRAQIRKFEKAEEELYKSLGRPPFPEELAEYMEISIEDLDKVLLLNKVSTVTSVDRNMETQGETTELADLLKDPQAENPDELAIKEELKDRMAEALKTLPEKERMVLVLNYFEELRQSEIAQVLDVSPSWVSQIHARALQRLKAILG